MSPRFVSGRMASVWIPLGIFALTRLVSAVFLMAAAPDQPALGAHLGLKIVEPLPASPGYWDVVANWDGQWYKSIAVDGYPTTLPTKDGEVVQNEWAYYPVYPMLVRFLMWATGLSFEVVAASVSLLCGAVFVVVLYRWLIKQTTRFAAGATIAAICAFPVAPVLQFAYTESLTLLLIAGVFIALHARKYGVVLLLSVLISLTRPIVLPLALVIGVHWIVRARREGARFRTGERVAVGLLAPAVAALTALWPAIAGYVTGEPRAFLLTQEAWRYDPEASLLQASTLGRVLDNPVAVLLVLLSAVVALIVVRPTSRAWGVEFRAWALGYTAYLLLSTQPSLSSVRYLFLALIPWWPFVGEGLALEEYRRASWRRWIVLAALLVVETVAQYYWIRDVYVIGDHPDQQWFP